MQDRRSDAVFDCEIIFKSIRNTQRKVTDCWRNECFAQWRHSADEYLMVFYSVFEGFFLGGQLQQSLRTSAQHEPVILLMIVTTESLYITTASMLSLNFLTTLLRQSHISYVSISLPLGEIICLTFLIRRKIHHQCPPGTHRNALTRTNMNK